MEKTQLLSKINNHLKSYVSLANQNHHRNYKTVFLNKTQLKSFYNDMQHKQFALASANKTKNHSTFKKNAKKIPIVEWKEADQQPMNTTPLFVSGKENKNDKKQHLNGFQRLKYKKNTSIFERNDRQNKFEGIRKKQKLKSQYISCYKNNPDIEWIEFENQKLKNEVMSLSMQYQPKINEENCGQKVCIRKKERMEEEENEEEDVIKFKIIEEEKFINRYRKGQKKLSMFQNENKNELNLENSKKISEIFVTIFDQSVNSKNYQKIRQKQTQKQDRDSNKQILFSIEAYFLKKNRYFPYP